jgi:hypothetical protein
MRQEATSTSTNEVRDLAKRGRVDGAKGVWNLSLISNKSRSTAKSPQRPCESSGIFEKAILSPAALHADRAVAKRVRILRPPFQKELRLQPLGAGTFSRRGRSLSRLFLLSTSVTWISDDPQHDVPSVSVVGSANASTPALSVLLPARRRRGAQCLSSERAPRHRGIAFEQHHERAGGLCVVRYEVGRLPNVFHRVRQV